MSYSKAVINHFENPQNVGSMNAADANVGTGLVGAPACGDVMKLQLKITDEGIIEDAKFKTFGCGSALASSSLVTTWVMERSLRKVHRNYQQKQTMTSTKVRGLLTVCQRGFCGKRSSLSLRSCMSDTL